MALPHAHLPLLDDSESDEALVARLTNGDGHAFHLLYERLFPRIYSYAAHHRKKSRDVEELTEAVFETVVSSLAEFSGQNEDRPFAAWVLAIARLVEGRDSR